MRARVNVNVDQMGSDINAVYNAEETDAAKIIVELCKSFYDLRWMPATAGGMSIRDGTSIFISPSGVQKERMRSEDITIFDCNTNQYVGKSVFKPSASAPLFKAIHKIRNVDACIHTHSESSVLATLLFEDTFEISNIENMKAIPKGDGSGNYGAFETIRIPIIENKPHEEDLEDSLVETLHKYPEAPAILVRRHGVFTWGSNVWKAKVVHEALDYLFVLSVEMKKVGIKYI